MILFVGINLIEYGRQSGYYLGDRAVLVQCLLLIDFAFLPSVGGGQGL